jgi:hypothetical protein
MNRFLSERGEFLKPVTEHRTQQTGNKKGVVPEMVDYSS